MHRPANSSDPRGLRVTVFHPKGAQLDSLMAQLARIACVAHAFWPPTIAPPQGTELVMFSVCGDASDMELSWARQTSAPPVIALVAQESQASLRLMQRLGANAVLPLPLQGEGLLSAIALARALHEQQRELQRRLQKLEQKLDSLNVLNDAKSILIRTRHVNEEQAYTLIRERAMATRTSTDQVARSIVDANQVLGL